MNVPRYFPAMSDAEAAEDRGDLHASLGFYREAAAGAPSFGMYLAVQADVERLENRLMAGESTLADERCLTCDDYVPITHQEQRELNAQGWPGLDCSACASVNAAMEYAQAMTLWNAA